MTSQPPTLSPTDILNTLIDEWQAAGRNLHQVSLDEVKRRFAEALRDHSDQFEIERASTAAV